MFTFEATDDGFAVLREGYVVARVDAASTDALWSEKTRAMVYQRKPLARTAWRLHFTGRLFTEAEVDALLKELATQQ
jgi:hypothetical protein